MAKARTLSLHVALAIVAGALFGGCGKATPRLEAEVNGNAVILYSTSSIEDRCDVQVMFSYVQDGIRKSAGHYCTGCIVPVGEHVQISDIKDAIIVDARIESVNSICKSENRTDRPAWQK